MIRILVDSTADFTNEQLKQNNLTYIPMHINWDDTEYISGVTIQSEEFYERLEASSSFPKTSQPSPQSFVEEFEKVKEEKDEMICILLSSALSGTYQSACLAKQMVDYDSIYVIDSKTATAGIQLLVEEAMKMVDAGMSCEEIVAHIEELKSRVMIYASVDTLEYLKRGGRISKAVASIGEIAKVKPLIHLNEAGEIVAISKSIGFKKVTAKIAEYSLDADPNYSILSLYTKGTKNMEKLEEKVKENNVNITDRVQVGPTIGCHIGTEAFGVAFICK